MKTLEITHLLTSQPKKYCPRAKRICQFLHLLRQQELIQVVGRDDFELRIGIGLGKAVRLFGLFACVPLELVGMELAVKFFNIVNFLLCAGAPEISVAVVGWPRT